MKQMFVLGDSVSIHYRPYLVQYLRGAASCELNRKEMEIARIDLDNPMGVNAGDSSLLLRKVRELAAGVLPECDILVLNCGLHDVKRDRKTGRIQVGLERYVENLSSVIEESVRAGGLVVWVNTTPVDDGVHNSRSLFDRFNKDVIEYNEAAAAIMRMKNVPVVDLHGFCVNLSGDRYCDHVHFTEEVRALQAAFIAGAVRAVAF